MISRILLITSITFLASASAQMMQEYSLNDGAGIRSYTVACDELHCRPTEGTDHSFKIQPQKNTSETADYAAAQEIREAASFDLVLYETGKPRIARFRKSLSRRILVTMDGTIPAMLIAKAARASSFKIPHFSNRHVILSFAKPGDSLRMLQDTAKLPGIAAARPLMGSRKTKRFTPNDPLFSWNSSNSRKRGGHWA